MPRFNLDFMHGGEDERVPDETTPQGTQALGVEHGHEEKDVDLTAILKWFAGLGIVVAVTLAGVWLVLVVWDDVERGKDIPPSQVFATRQIPPEPRLFPNPADWPGSDTQGFKVAGPGRSGPNDKRSGSNPIIPDPTRIGDEIRAGENEALQAAKLQNSEGQPDLPPGGLEAAMKESGTGSSDAALTMPMPSLASGGTMTDNRLR